MQADLKRINELAKKAKQEGLTEREKQEQKILRQNYLKQFRRAFEQQLHEVTVVDIEGNDVTPKKLKDSKRQRKLRH